MSSSRDTEITLGVGKLLGLFFTLVALCGLSLGIGYWLGWNQAARAGMRASSGAAASSAAAGAPAESATSGTNSAASPAASSAASAPENSELTFYQSVQQNNPEPKLAPPATPAAAPKQHATLGGGYLVQIAAVTREDDAKLLKKALEKERYPVLINAPGDKLYHVQVGPYATVKEAQEIRSRLISAGYRAFLKH